MYACMWPRNATKAGHVAASMLPAVTSAAMNGTHRASLGMQADTLNSVGMLFELRFRYESILHFQSYFGGCRPPVI